MELQTCIKVIEEYFASNEIDLADEVLLRTVYNKMLGHIEALQKNEPVVVEDISEYKKAIQFIGTMMLMSAIRNTTPQFIRAYSKLMYNWNKNLHEDQDIKLMSLMAEALAVSYETMLFCFDKTKELSVFHRKQRNWQTSAIDINKAYLDKLMDENERRQQKTTSPET